MKALSIVFAFMIVSNVVSAQLSKEFNDKCHVYVVDVAKASKADDDLENSREAFKKALASAETTFPEFTTKIGEEELTTRHFPFPNSKLFITASVFYTDESMTSHPQGDYQLNDQSMLIGIMVSSKAEESALSGSTPNATVTEVTYDEYTNIVRTKQYVVVDGRKYLLGLQCDCLKGRSKK
jgi:hypothetical protein